MAQLALFHQDSAILQSQPPVYHRCLRLKTLQTAAGSASAAWALTAVVWSVSVVLIFLEIVKAVVVVFIVVGGGITVGCSLSGQAR